MWITKGQPSQAHSIVTENYVWQKLKIPTLPWIFTQSSPPISTILTSDYLWKILVLWESHECLDRTLSKHENLFHF